MSRRLWATITITIAMVVTGCAGARTAQLKAAGCIPNPGQTDTGGHDQDPVGTGGFGTNETVDGNPSTTSQEMAGSEGVAVIQVVSRAAPGAADGEQHGARPSTVHAPPAGAQPVFTVLRPTRFAVLRQFKGQFDPCLDLDVPGGSTGRYVTNSALFPAFHGPGDKMLGLFADHDQPGQREPLWAQRLLKAAPDGTVILPWNGEQINVNTWDPSTDPGPTPPAEPTQSPGPDTAGSHQCWQPGQPPPDRNAPPPCGRGTTP